MYKTLKTKFLFVLILFLFNYNIFSQNSRIYQFGGHLSSNYTNTNQPIFGHEQYGTFILKCNGGSLIWHKWSIDNSDTQFFFSKKLEIYTGLFIFSRYTFYNSINENIRSGEFKIYPYLSFYFPYNLFCYLSIGMYSTIWRAWDSNLSISLYNPKAIGIGVGYELGCGYTLPIFKGAKLEPYIAYNSNNLNQKLNDNYNIKEKITNIFLIISIQVYLEK